MNQVKNLEAIEGGQRAAALRGMLEAYLDDMTRDRVAHLISVYKNGKVDHDKMLGLVAEISVLRDIFSNLESDMNAAALAMEREHKNATRQE